MRFYSSPVDLNIDAVLKGQGYHVDTDLSGMLVDN